MEGSQSRPIVLLLVSMAAIFIVAFGIRASAAILNPILLAVVITIVALPLPAKLAQRGLPGWLSFVLTLAAVIGGIALVGLVVFISLTQLPADIAGQAPDTSGDGQSTGGLFSSFLSPGQAQQLAELVIRGVANGLVLMFMVLLIFIFMLSAAVSLPSGNRLGLRPDSSALKSVAQLTEEVRHYMSIMTSVNFFVGLGDVILLWILGVPYAVLWGILSWVMGYIPTVGFWFALIPPVIIAYTTLGLETAVIVFLGYVLINGSVQNFIQPRMMGQGLGISPVVVFISLFVWGWLLGGVGAILAVPLTMIIMAVMGSSPNTRWIAILMSAPKSDKYDDHQNARGKLRGLWKRTKHGVMGNGGGQDDASDDTSTSDLESPEKEGDNKEEVEPMADMAQQSDQIVNENET
jgi:AI-2 transport protein TqsA